MSARHRRDQGTADAGAPDLAVLSGAPDVTELAAITAVLTAVAQEVAESDAVVQDRGASSWERNVSRLRAPLRPGAGAWRGFTG